MTRAVVAEGEKASTYGWLQLEKKAAKELQNLAVKSPAAMGTLLYLVNNMGRDNALIVSQKTIAAALGLSLKSVGNSVKLLDAHHFIEAIKVGNMSVYRVNSRVAWQGNRGARFAHFGAEVIAMENEQDQAIDDLPPLKSVPVLNAGESQSRLENGDNWYEISTRMSPMNTKPSFKPAVPGLPPAAPSDARQRITVDVPLGILSLLDNYCDVTGQARSAVVLALLAQQLPVLDGHAQDLRQRSQKAAQQAQQTRR